MPARFKVVLDANIAIADLLHKLKTPGLRQTAIEECARAGTLEVYAPRWLDEEMKDRAIPLVAQRKGLDAEALVALWAEYRDLLVWDETIRRPDETAADIGDVKDVPYVELQRKIEAVGILSRDKDIEQLGGTVLQLEFVLTVRRYARAASTHLSIHVNGMFIGVLSTVALIGIVRGAAKIISQVPPWGKCILLIGLCIAIAHPQSRKSILKQMEMLLGVGGTATPYLWDLIELSEEKRIEAERELSATNRLIQKIEHNVTQPY